MVAKTLRSMCAMVSTEACGAAAMVASALGNVALLLLSKALQSQHWPLFRMLGTCCLVVSAGIAGVLAATRTQLHDVHQVPWVLMRGFFGTLSSVLSTLAVLVGAPVGDAGALMSTNVVAAALLGRLVLNEPLQWLHAGVLGCTVTGAVLISQPGFIFSGSLPPSSTPWLGYAFALGSGFCLACQYISSRKSSGVPTAYMSLSAMIQRGLAYWVLSFTPMVDDSSMAPVLDSPGQSIAWLVPIIALTATSTMAQSAASQWCPAAISATVYQTVIVVVGYLAEMVFYKHAPKLLTLVGAALMLVAVTIMALMRVPSPRSPDMALCTEPVQGLAGPEAWVSTSASSRASISDTSSGAHEEEEESLASFIAAEFVEQTPHNHQVRQRRTTRLMQSGVPASCPAVVASAAVQVIGMVVVV